MNASRSGSEEALLPKGALGSPPRNQPTISYWCKKCGGYLFSATNDWLRVSNSAVVHRMQKYRSDDVITSLIPGVQHLDGAKKFSGCRLKHLLCNSKKDCKSKIGMLCISGTREKRYKDWAFFRDQNIEVRRGRNYPTESFVIDGVRPERPEDRRLTRQADPALAPSRLPRSNRPSTTTTREASQSSAQSPPATTTAPESQEEDGGIDIHGSPQPDLNESPQATPSSQRIIPIRVDTARATPQYVAETRRSTVRNDPGSLSGDRSKRVSTLRNGSQEPPRAHTGSTHRSISSDESEGEDGPPIIQPRAQGLSRDELVEKVDNQSIQLQKQGLLIERQEKAMATRDKTIRDLSSRVSTLEQQLKSHLQEFTGILESIRRDSNHRSHSSGTRTISGSKRNFHEISNDDQGLEPYESLHEPMTGSESAAGPAPSRSRVPTQVPPKTQPPKPTDNVRTALVQDSIAPLSEQVNSEDTSQETQAYLERTVRQDDSDDIDYRPTQNDSTIPSTATRTRHGFETSDLAVNRLLSPAHPLQRSPHSKITSSSRSGAGLSAGGTVGLNRISDQRVMSNGFSSASPHSPSHAGRLKSRGVSGGRSKSVVVPQLSHANLAAANANSNYSAGYNVTSTPETFEPNKRQRTDLGAGSFKRDNTPPGSAAGGFKGTRDAEGYLLKANGQRDLRSIRGRTLGNEAFKSANGQRRTVASLAAEGFRPGSSMASPAVSFGGTPRQSQSTQVTASTVTPIDTRFPPPAATVSPWRGVTTIADHMAMLQGSPSGERQGQYDMAQEMERIQRKRLDDAMTKGPAIGKQYTSRHASFMQKLGIME